jgi:RND family efflux transporter MFP subunit
MEQSQAMATKPQASRSIRFVVNFIIKVIVPLLIVAAALGFTKHQMDTRPQAKRKKPPRQARLVMVETARQETMAAIVDKGMGTVMPAQRVTLMPEVSGLVTALDEDVIPGGFVEANQILLHIDPRDYHAALDQRLGERAQAHLNLKLELGNQKIALQEYELLSQEVEGDERELVLRQPHLASAEAALKAANAALARAQLDLERCRIAAPFNAVIETKHVDPGARVGPGSALLTLAGTDAYWIDLKVPVTDLKWIRIPQGNQRNGSKVKVIDQDAWGAHGWREGRVIRLLAGLETQGRMARLLVAVEDPLALHSQKGKPPMLLGSYVRAEIEGVDLTGGIPLRRELLRDGDQVWVMKGDQTLEIRPIDILFRGREQVYVGSGLAPGEKIVVTDIAAPVAGMALRLEGDSPMATEETERPGGRP